MLFILTFIIVRITQQTEFVGCELFTQTPYDAYSSGVDDIVQDFHGNAHTIGIWIKWNPMLYKEYLQTIQDPTYQILVEKTSSGKITLAFYLFNDLALQQFQFLVYMLENNNEKKNGLLVDGQILEGNWGFFCFSYSITLKTYMIYLYFPIENQAEKYVQSFKGTLQDRTTDTYTYITDLYTKNALEQIPMYLYDQKLRFKPFLGYRTKPYFSDNFLATITDFLAINQFSCQQYNYCNGLSNLAQIQTNNYLFKEQPQDFPFIIRTTYMEGRYSFSGWIKYNYYGDDKKNNGIANVIRVCLFEFYSDDYVLGDRVFLLKYIPNFYSSYDSKIEIYTFTQIYPNIIFYSSTAADIYTAKGSEIDALMYKWHFFQFQYGLTGMYPNTARILIQDGETNQNIINYNFQQRNHFKSAQVIINFGADKYSQNTLVGQIENVKLNYCFTSDQALVFSCHQVCQTCFGPYRTQCLQCSNSDQILKNNECICLRNSLEKSDYSCLKHNDFLAPLQIQTNLKTSKCDQGQFILNKDDGTYMCINCPSYSLINSIICADCYVNAKTWSSNPICSMDFKTPVNETSLSVSDNLFNLINRNQIDYEYYLISLNGDIQLCVGCLGPQTDNQVYIEKYQLSQLIKVICKPCHKIINNECILQNNNCIECNDDYSCLTCEDGYISYNTGCQKCPIVCNECVMQQDKVQCQSCPYQYYLSNGQCIKCGANCLICNEIQCIKCTDVNKYYLSVNSIDCQLNTINNCNIAYELYKNIDMNSLVIDYTMNYNRDDTIVQCAMCNPKFINKLTSCEPTIAYEESILPTYTLDGSQIITLNRTQFEIESQVCKKQYCESTIYQDGWKYQLNGFIKNITQSQQKFYMIGDFTTGDNACLLSLNQSISMTASCSSCNIGYELYYGKCIEQCPSDCQCIKQNSANVCYKCKSNERGAKLTLSNGKCIECPYNCALCKIRTQAELLDINPYFNASSSFQYFGYQCLKSYQDSTFEHDYDLGVYIECPTGACENSITIQFNYYCDSIGYNTAKSSYVGDPLQFQKFNILLSDYSKYTPFYEDEQFYLVLNQRTIKKITFQVTLQSSTATCALPQNFIFNTKLRQNIFTLLDQELILTSKLPETQYSFANFYSIGFSSVSFSNLNLTNDPLYDSKLLISDDYGTDVTLDTLTFTNKNKRLQIIIQNPISLLCNKITFQDIIVSNTEGIFVYLGNYQKKMLQIQYIDLNLINVQLKNSTFMIFSLTDGFDNQQIDMDKLTVIDSQFTKSKIFYTNYTLSSRKSTIQMNDLIQQNSHLVSSTFISFEGFKLVTISNALLNSTSFDQSSVWMVLPLFIINDFTIINNILLSNDDRFITNKATIAYSDTNNDLNTIQLTKIKLSENQFSSNRAFIEIYQDIFYNLHILLDQIQLIKNQLYGSESNYKDKNLASENSTIYLDVYTALITNFYILRSKTYPELAILNSQSAQIVNLIAEHSQKKTTFLHDNIYCEQQFLFPQGYSALLYLYNIKDIILTKLSFSDLRSINLPLILIKSQDKVKIKQNETIIVQDSQFQRNLLIISKISEQQTIIQINSEQYQSILINNTWFLQNYQHSYVQDLTFQSSSTIFLSSPYSIIKLQYITFENNLQTNGQNSNLVLRCDKIYLTNCSFLSSNQPPIDTINRNIYWGIQSDQVLYYENYTLSFPILSQGGSGFLSANVIELIDLLIRDSRSQRGGAFYLLPKSQGIINLKRITFQNCQASLEKVSSAQGGTLYIDASLSSLVLTIQDTDFIQSYSRKEGGVIYINPSKTQNDISFENINVFESYSLYDSFIKIPNTYSVNMAIQNMLCNNTFEGFRVFLGQLYYLSEIELSEFQSNYYMSLKGNVQISNAQFSNSLSGLFDFSDGSLILTNVRIVDLYIASQPIITLNNISPLIMQNVEIHNISLYQHVSQEVPECKVSYNALQMTCQGETSLPSYLYIAMNNTIIDYYAEYNLNNLALNFPAITTVIIVTNIQESHKIKILDTKFTEISCAQCQNGLARFELQQYYDLGTNIIQIENSQIEYNNCGLSCFVFVQTSTARLLSTQRGLEEIPQQYKQSLIYTIQVLTTECKKNYGIKGGCFYVDNLNILFDKCYFNYNTADQQGGVLYFKSVESTLNIYDTDISHNIAAIGGAFYLNNYTLNDPSVLNLKLINNYASKYGQNYAEYPNQLTISLDGGKSYLEKTTVESTVKRIIELITIKPFNFNNQTRYYVTLPSGQKFNSYKFYNETTQQFVSYNLTFRIIALNKQKNKIQNLDGTKCTISSSIVYKNSSDQIDPILYTNTTNTYTDKKEVEFNTDYQEYDLDDMIIYFDSLENSQAVLQLEFQCNSVKIPIFSKLPPYLMENQLENYKLRINVQSFDCQSGEQKRNDDGTCLVCDSTQDQYTVQPGQQCSIRDAVSTEEVTSASVKLRAGYWRPYSYSVTIEYCLNMEINCNGGWIPGNPSCFEGHIGALCEQCDIYNIQGNGQWSVSSPYKCGNCLQIGDNSIKVAMISIWTIISIMLSVKSTMETVEKMVLGKKLSKFFVENPKTGYGGTLIKVLTNYLQIIGVMSTFHLSLPSAMTTVFKTIGTPVESMSYSLDCFLIKMSSIDIIYFRMIWALIMPLIYILTFFFLYFLAIIAGISKFSKSAITTTFIYLFTFLQPTLLGGFISLLSFRQISDIYWIQGNVAYRYDTKLHFHWVLTFIFPSSFILALVIPTYMFLSLYRIKGSLDQEINRKNWGYLYNEYQPKAYFWELVKIFEKSFIIIFLTFYEDLIIIKGALIFLIVFIYSGFTKKFRPFKLPFLNYIDDISTLVCGTSIVVGITLYSANQTDNQEIIWPFYLFLIIINAVFIVIILWEIIWAQLEDLQGTLDKIRDKINEKYPQLQYRNWLCKRLLTNRGEQLKRVKKRWLMVRNYLFGLIRKHHLQIAKPDKLSENPSEDLDISDVGSLPNLPKFYNQMHPEIFVEQYASDVQLSFQEFQK